MNGDYEHVEAAKILQFGSYDLLDLATPQPGTENSTSDLLSSEDSDAHYIEKSEYRNFRTRRKYQCHHTQAIILLSLFVCLIVSSIALLGVKSLGPCRYNTILSFNRKDIVPYMSTRNSTQYQLTDDNNGTRFQVTLFGDSLINRPFLNLDLDGKIRSYLPQFELDITNIASSGCKISDMRNKLADVIDTEPKLDAVILYWDSDVSDVDESKMTLSEVDDLRLKYRTDLSYILSELARNITYVAVAGPGILGQCSMG
jgi:hypothetical protein